MSPAESSHQNQGGAAQVESFGVSWEESYGYVQAVKRGDMIYLSGQFTRDGEKPVAPAPVDDQGRVTDFGNMAEQMRQTYVNAAKLLARFGASLADVVEARHDRLPGGQTDRADLVQRASPLQSRSCVAMDVSRWVDLLSPVGEHQLLN